MQWGKYGGYENMIIINPRFYNRGYKHIIPTGLVVNILGIENIFLKISY